MPQAVVPWSSGIFPTAKSLNLALYTCLGDGTIDNPNGILFHTYRPMLFETYNRTLTLPAIPGSTQTVLASSGTITASRVVLDTAGYFGQTSDLPGLGYYTFTAAVHGSSGDGVTPGGMTIMAHFLPVVHTSTQTSISADIVQLNGSTISGSRQSPNATNDSTAFFCDLVNVGLSTWQPAVTIRDSATVSTSNGLNATDSSGKTPRMLALWGSASSTSAGIAQYLVGGTYTFTAPTGVRSITAACMGAGAGGGAGNVSAGGAEFGGGGGGGGEFSQNTVGVTPGNNYPVTVGSGGVAGVAPGTIGSAGGNSAFSGDSVTNTGHGGSGGGGATTSASGAAGAGGTGSAAPAHFNGGAGAAGSSGAFGGGGGSSAGTGTVGNAASGSAGGSAPVGGGPGGAGGKLTISVVQTASANKANVNTFTVSFHSPVQAGNTVVVCVNAQSFHFTTAPNCNLSDGTAMTEQQSLSVLGNGGISANVAVFDIYNVTGGQTGVKVSNIGSTNRVFCVQAFEIAGLGTSPTIDVSTSASNQSSTYSSSVATAQAPEIWIGTVGCTKNTSFSISAASGWTNLGQTGTNSGSEFAGIRSGYKLTTSPGTMNYKGSLSGSIYWADISIAYASSSLTPGGAPVIGPGGAGGGGLGNNDGGNGVDGSVILTWTGITGGGYGTPALPTPFSNWTVDTVIGTASDPGIDVDINGSSGITAVVNFLANAPAFRIASTNPQSIANASVVQWLPPSTVTPTVDSYSGWSTGSGVYTVQRDGIYLAHGMAAFAANATGTRQAAFTVNGVTYWGPGYKAATSGSTNATKTQIFVLQAGDTIAMSCRQDSGGAITLSGAAADATRFFLIWLGASGFPAGGWSPPDATFRWLSGTSGDDLPDLFQQHLANDLGFLVNRPYLTAYQTAAQSNLTVGAFSTVTMDTVNGLVHPGITGDNYGGWAPSTSSYVAQENGWYLEAGEVFAASSAAAGAAVAAAVLPTTSGGYTPSTTPDWYQVMSATATASVGAGATILGVRYMLAGESATPQIEAQSYAAAYSTLTGSSNSGFFYPHYELIWVSS